MISMPSTSPSPRVDADQAQEGADHGRLARAIGSEQADGACGNLDGEAVQGGDLAVGLGHLREAEEMHGRSWEKGFACCLPLAGWKRSGDL